MVAVRRARPRSERGAAAVEFALLSLPLCLILFGIIDYGIWFADAISARQAVRDGARNGAVENFGACSPKVTTGTDADLRNLACTVKALASPLSGSIAVRVVIVSNPNPTTASGAAWQPGNTLRVCAINSHTSLLPLVPFPGGGIGRAEVNIPIEQAGSGGAATRTGYAGDPPPAGANWSWCP